MRSLYVAFVVASHLAGLAFAVWSTRTGGVPVPVLLYAFFFDATLRLATVPILHAALTTELRVVRAVASALIRRPRDGEVSDPVRESEDGPPAGPGVHLLVMAVLGGFAFMMANVDADGQWATGPPDVLRDVAWATMIGGIYWGNSLMTRTLTIHPARSVPHNLGYNTREMSILALAVLAGGAVVVARQSMGLDASAWAVMGPLLAFRALYDMSASLGGPSGSAKRARPRAHGTR
jgi:hypothetical protein